MRRTPVILTALLASAAVAGVALAQAADPAAARIETLNAAMTQDFAKVGAQDMAGRARLLQPAISDAFDMPTIARLSVGPAWAALTADQQASLTEAILRLSVATAAHNFEAYDGKRLVVDPKVDSNGVDKLVRSQIISAKGKATDVIYRMRQDAAGQWKVIDIFYNGKISEVAVRRADFSATLGKGGAPALLAQIDAQSAKLLTTG